MTHITALPTPAPAREQERIGRNRLLAQLPAADFALLAPHLVDVALDRGTLLQEAGERIKRVYFPHSGVVSLLGVLAEGDAIDAAMIGREGGIGLSAGLGSVTAVSRALVQLPARAAHVAADVFAEATQCSTALRDMIVRHDDLLLAQMQQSVACNALHHVQGRLCRWLLQARDRVGDDTLPLTQEFLSDILGVQRTTVTIISRALQADGIISVRRGRIQIRDERALESKACSCYGIVRDLTQRTQHAKTG